METYDRMISLLKLLSNERFKLHTNMIRKMILEKRRGIRKYFALLSMEDWWYLVFRTPNGRGAYLFLRLLDKEIKEKDSLKKSTEPLDIAIKALIEPKRAPYIWEFITSCENCKLADEDKKEDEKEDEGPPAEEKEKEIGPLPYPPGGTH